MRIVLLYLLRVATVGSCSMWQHGCVSSFASGRSCGATAATLVVAFVMLAAFPFFHSATACGHPDPAGGSCFQFGGAATLAALPVASFVFVLLWSTLQDLAEVLDVVDVFDGVCALVATFWCLDGDIGVLCSSRSFTPAVCISSLCAFVGDVPFLEGIQCFLKWCHRRCRCCPWSLLRTFQLVFLKL